MVILDPGLYKQSLAKVWTSTAEIALTTTGIVNSGVVGDMAELMYVAVACSDSLGGRLSAIMGPSCGGGLR